MDYQQRLVRRQYADASRLDERSSLHASYGTAPGSWQTWVFDHLDLPPIASILEVGGGPGDLWRVNRDRVPQGWSVTLTDMSPGMTRDARTRLGTAAGPAAPSLAVADAMRLPFEESGFNAVVANHMLYHVADVDAALTEIARVLRPGGFLFAATVGLGHMRELFAVASAASSVAAAAQAPRVGQFSLESGTGALSGHFDDVRLETYDNPLEVDRLEPLMDYLASTEAGRSMSAAERDVCRNQYQAVIDRDGAFRITTETGLYVAAATHTAE